MAATVGLGSRALPKGSPEWLSLARRAQRLSWLSLLYMTMEGSVAVVAAVLAGSVALLGFGIDSGIEAMASVVVVWRFSGSRTLSETAERRAQQVVAVSFFLLAPVVAYEAIARLASGQHPQTSWPGIAIATLSLLWMPVLATMKKRLGARLGSEATAGEGGQNLLCAYLAAAVLASLLANTLFGYWWLDPAVGLGVAGLALREGREAWRGRDCC